MVANGCRMTLRPGWNIFHGYTYHICYTHKMILHTTVIREKNAANPFPYNSLTEFYSMTNQKKKKKRWRENKRPDWPYCLQTWAGQERSILAFIVGLKSSVCLSVPEQSVPGGLLVPSTSSCLQVTHVSSRTAVLRVRAAHGLLNIRLD